jgi:hypothetical protein
MIIEQSRNMLFPCRLEKLHVLLGSHQWLHQFDAHLIEQLRSLGK